MIMYLVLIGAVFLLSLIIGKISVVKLRELKLAQTIRDDGPKSHFEKAGTPSMGGLIFIIPIIIASFFLMPAAVLPLLAMVAYGALGMYDDLEKRVIKKGKGLSVKKKFLLQILVGLVLAVIAFFVKGGAVIGFSNSVSFNINIVVYFIFMTVYFVGVTNAVNLTDGLDGLSTMVTLPIMVVFILISLLQGNYQMVGVCGVVLVALLGFLIFNLHPAKIFMGDTGSMALGALIAGIAIVLKVELLLLILGLVYIAETLSVMLQVLYFKATGGKRLFKMAPLHHHFELSGMKETAVVKWFTIASCIISLIAFIIYWSI